MTFKANTAYGHVKVVYRGAYTLPAMLSQKGYMACHSDVTPQWLLEVKAFRMAA